MADLFAPQFQGDVAYERPLEPVQKPSPLAALAGLGEFFVGQYGDKLAQDARAAGTRSTKTDPNIAIFQQGLEKVEAIRQQKGETAALIAERRLASNFAMAGIDFGTEYKNVYTTMTGREWAGYGRDTESYMREQALKDAEVQASFIGSYAVLPQEATDEERLEYAIGQKATVQASADIIARAKAGAGVKWTTETEAAYSKVIDTYVTRNIGALVATVRQGGRVGPQSIANLQASLAQLKFDLSRPSGVTDDQWKSTQDRINNLDGVIQSLGKASSSDVLFEEITTALANNLLKEGGGSLESQLSALTVLKDPSVLATLGGVGVEQFIMDVGKGIKIDLTSPQLFSSITEQPGADTAEEGVVTIETLPAAIQTAVAGLTAQQFYDGLVASGKITSLTDNSSLQRPEGRDQFIENASKMGAVLMSMENDQFLSADFLKKLVANPQFIRNVEALKGVSPEGDATVRSYVVSGLNVERARQERNLSATEARATAAVWDGQGYVLNREDLASRVSGQRIEAFDRALTRYYGGDLSSAARDGFRKMYEVTDVIQVGGLYNLENAVGRRDALKVIQSTVSKLDPRLPEQKAPELGDPLPTPEDLGIVTNKSMKPLIGSLEGASRLTVQGADQRLNSLLSGPFQDMQRIFGKPVMINDAIAKVGTSREKDTPGSRHFHGDALDINISGMSDADKLRLVDAAIEAGFQGFGFGNGVLHIDMGKRRYWDYGISTFGGEPLSEVTDKVSGSTVPRPSLASVGMLGDLNVIEADPGEGAAANFNVVYQVPQSVAQDTQFISEVSRVSQGLGIDQNWLLRIIEFETAGSWDPAVKAPTSSATGLIQFLESTAKDLGTTTAELAGMTRAQQMKFVEKYLSPYKGRIKNFGDLYMAVHWPKAVGKSDDYVMYEKGSDAYAANSGLDKNKDGTVTRGETLQRVMESTGGGMMTTARTAAAEAALAPPVEQLLPPAPAAVGQVDAGAAGAPAATATTEDQAPEGEAVQDTGGQAFQPSEEETQAVADKIFADYPPEIRDLVLRFTGTVSGEPLTREEVQQINDYLESRRK